MIRFHLVRFMRENRLSGSEGGATLIQPSLPLSFIQFPPGQKLHVIPALLSNKRTLLIS